MSLTVDQVKSAIYIHGYYPVLQLLRDEQEREDYANCAVIKEALDKVGEGREWYLSPSVDDDDMRRTLDNILQSSRNPDLYLNNLPACTQDCRHTLKLK